MNLIIEFILRIPNLYHFHIYYLIKIILCLKYISYANILYTLLSTFTRYFDFRPHLLKQKQKGVAQKTKHKNTFQYLKTVPRLSARIRAIRKAQKGKCKQSQTNKTGYFSFIVSPQITDTHAHTHRVVFSGHFSGFPFVSAVTKVYTEDTARSQKLTWKKGGKSEAI